MKNTFIKPPLECFEFDGLVINIGDTISFNVARNVSQTLTGKVAYTDAMSFITFAEDKQYELKKLMNIKIIEKKDVIDENKRFNYMMLSRLKSDCEYFLNWGGGNIKNLYFDDINEHISEMKRLWNGYLIKILNFMSKKCSLIQNNI